MSRLQMSLRVLLLAVCCLVYGYAKPIVSVSVPPQAYFVQQIAGDSVEINVIIPPNVDEHNFDIKPQTMQSLEKSSVYFTTGLEIEKILLQKLKDYKGINVVSLNEDESMSHSHDTHEHHDHDHDAHEHSHDNDPHVWLNPKLVAVQAEKITEALIKVEPKNSKLYADNLRTFLDRIQKLDSDIKDDLADIKHREFIVYHPSLGHFAEAYAFKQIPIEINGKEPKPKDMQGLIEYAKKERIGIILIQPGFADSLARQIARECGAEVVVINHLSQDWEQEMRKIAKVLAENLR